MPKITFSLILEALPKRGLLLKDQLASLLLRRKTYFYSASLSQSLVLKVDSVNFAFILPHVESVLHTH